MITRRTILLSILALLATLTSLGKGGSSNPSSTSSPPEPEPAPTIDQAVNTLRSFKQRIADETGEGNQAIPLRTFSSVRPGQICVLNECDDGVSSLQNYCEDAWLRIPDERPPDPAPIDLVEEFSADFTWSRSFDLDASFELNFLAVALESAFETQEIDRLEVRLRVLNARQELIDNAVVVKNQYESALQQTNQTATGNVLVAGVIRGELQMAYTALDSSNNTVDLSASVLANRINAKAAGNYVAADSTESNVVFESSVGSVLVVVVRRIDTALVDGAEVASVSNGVCADPTNIQRPPDSDLQERVILGFLPEEAVPVAQVRIEAREQAGGDCQVWDAILENIDPLRRSFTVNTTLQVRNLYGQVLPILGGTFDSLSCIDPGQPDPLGDILRPKNDDLCSFGIEDVTIVPLAFNVDVWSGSGCP